MAKLVLSFGRDEGAELFCADGTVINISIVSVKSNQVRICFDAPQSVSITRDTARNRPQNHARIGDGRAVPSVPKTSPGTPA